MANHQELVAEMLLLEQLPAQERLKLAHKRRMQQIQKWLDYENNVVHITPVNKNSKKKSPKNLRTWQSCGSDTESCSGAEPHELNGFFPENLKKLTIADLKAMDSDSNQKQNLAPKSHKSETNPPDAKQNGNYFYYYEDEQHDPHSPAPNREDEYSDMRGLHMEERYYPDIITSAKLSDIPGNNNHEPKLSNGQIARVEENNNGNYERTAVQDSRGHLESSRNGGNYDYSLPPNLFNSFAQDATDDASPNYSLSLENILKSPVKIKSSSHHNVLHNSQRTSAPSAAKPITLRAAGSKSPSQILDYANAEPASHAITDAYNNHNTTGTGGDEDSQHHIPSNMIIHNGLNYDDNENKLNYNDNGEAKNFEFHDKNNINVKDDNGSSHKADKNIIDKIIGKSNVKNNNNNNAAKINRYKSHKEERDMKERISGEKFAKGAHRRSKNVKFVPGIILLEAASRNDLDEVRELLESGIDPNVSNADGLTALHQCCIDDYYQMVELLLLHGADINACDTELWTPIHAAATCGHANLIKLFADRGANLLALNADGNMPYDMCEEELALDILETEMSNKGITQEDIDIARTFPEKLMLNDLIQTKESGLSLEVRDSRGISPLHIASANGYLSAVEFLLENDVHVNCQDNDLWTPLHAASFWGQPLIIECLINKDADIEAKNKDGETPIDICEDPEIKERLLDIKAEMEQNKILNSKNFWLHPNNNRISNRRNSSIRRSSIRDKNALSRREIIEEAKIRQFNHSLMDEKEQPVKLEKLTPLRDSSTEIPDSSIDNPYLSNQNNHKSILVQQSKANDPVNSNAEDLTMSINNNKEGTTVADNNTAAQNNNHVEGDSEGGTKTEPSKGKIMFQALRLVSKMKRHGAASGLVSTETNSLSEAKVSVYDNYEASCGKEAAINGEILRAGDCTEKRLLPDLKRARRAMKEGDSKTERASWSLLQLYEDGIEEEGEKNDSNNSNSNPEAGKEGNFKESSKKEEDEDSKSPYGTLSKNDPALSVRTVKPPRSPIITNSTANNVTVDHTQTGKNYDKSNNFECCIIL
ncbi:unnamed protein product [Gordionus sp. m RMFG-2023]|uniref:protein phosphatase 1 regulatory subunit 12B-like n=1 Tax=Gordionus sp. m RMFG-2023 TaxID=3053472 RepID=UPI0030E3E73C